MSSSPSISQNETGLIGTNITLEDINKAIKIQMNTESELTENSKLKIVGEGNGISSCVVEINCRWSVHSDELPQNLILKIVSLAHIQKMMNRAIEDDFAPFPEDHEPPDFVANCKRIHNQEVTFYEIIKTLESTGIMAPKVYFSQKFIAENPDSKGFIAMEYVKDSITRHNFENSTVEEIQPVLRAIAKLQLLTFKMSERDIEKIEKGSSDEEFIKMMTSEHGINASLEMCRRINKTGSSEKIEKIGNFIKDFMNEKAFLSLNEVVEIKHKVLCHGDLWSANILWRRKEDGELCASKILDYQLVHFGNPAEDLVRLLVSTLSGFDRQAYWEQILEQFFSYLLEEIGDNQTAPYTLQQLKLSYCIYFPLGALAILPLFGPGVDMKLQYMEEGEAKRCKSVIIEKVNCLLDDIETLYQNRKTFSKIL